VSPFTLTLADQAGAFARNKILWVDVLKDDGWQHLSALHDATRKEVESLRLVELENRPYRAHITLARKLDSASVDVIANRQNSGVSSFEGFPLAVAVDDLCLFESTRINGKLTYPVVERFDLKG
jgi:RNA 2',3'-cyclic 3'-phosphodiesterase